MSSIGINVDKSNAKNTVQKHRIVGYSKSVYEQPNQREKRTSSDQLSVSLSRYKFLNKKKRSYFFDLIFKW